ncbi:DNA-binding XRE family transcriptional regulator [Bacillus tianshenii]|uniref:DNA-binding XRE family transcriptional regulator n=1 Tax=Sutcliffiella tianshenii TaxID=1463404 RepID=A0ABS2NXF1_9BACI|nr:helix-turn-helix domain-containing protein [Bacillus tianshenii]MBM7619338.1 DNA-binding XRE family transcriptional regulator [Bacillus tianshenii]
MNQVETIHLISNKLKLIRIEYNYTQDKMAEILGISKKTLVQIEKGRNSASWTLTVAACALFRESEILTSVLGPDPLEVIETIAHEKIDSPKDKTMGGKVWWKEMEVSGKFRLQQNVISQHFRILDDFDFRWYSSFNREDAVQRIIELSNDRKGE